MTDEKRLDTLLAKKTTNRNLRDRIKRRWKEGNPNQRGEALYLLKKQARTKSDHTLDDAMRIYWRLTQQLQLALVAELRANDIDEMTVVKRWNGSPRSEGPSGRIHALKLLRKMYADACARARRETSRNVLEAIEKAIQEARLETHRQREDREQADPGPPKRLSRKQRQTILNRANQSLDDNYKGAARAFIVNEVDESGGRFKGLDQRRVADARYYEGAPVLLEFDRGYITKQRRDWTMRQSSHAHAAILRHHPQRDPTTGEVPPDALLLVDWDTWASTKRIEPLQQTTLSTMWSGLARGLDLGFILGPKAFRRFRTTSRSVQAVPPEQIRRLSSHARGSASRLFYTIYDRDDAIDIRDRLGFRTAAKGAFCPRCSQWQPTQALTCPTCRVPLDESIMAHLANPAYWNNERIGRFGLRLLELEKAMASEAMP